MFYSNFGKEATDSYHRTIWVISYHCKWIYERLNIWTVENSKGVNDHNSYILSFSSCGIITWKKSQQWSKIKESFCSAPPSRCIPGRGQKWLWFNLVSHWWSLHAWVWVQHNLFHTLLLKWPFFSLQNVYF